jgi:uncharacterized hydrophobic protein (TIGR00271 family)
MTQRRFALLNVPYKRKAAVIEEIKFGSEPRRGFYFLLVASSLIAAFGLVANSTAVIIGAMLVSPLMTPIFGIALAMVRGNTSLLGRAIRAEAVGIFLAVGVSAVFGFFPLAIKATPEMLARTEPTLLDLLVAVLAGFAGAYAMIDERISPSLPGVAIATAIVPPLSNTGLCLALGAYEGAVGSFLLFSANLFSILLVGAITFAAAGMAAKPKDKILWSIVRNFGVTIIGFIFIAVVLTASLIGIVRDREMEDVIHTTLFEKFSKLHAIYLDTFTYDLEEDNLYILAHARAPQLISPDAVSEIQEELSRRLSRPTELVIRINIAKDIGATGSVTQVTPQDLDGDFLDEDISAKELNIRGAEQVLLERISSLPGSRLMNVDLIDLPRGPTVIATLQGFRMLHPEEIREIEKEIRSRLQTADIGLIIQFLPSVFSDGQGRLLYEWSRYGRPTAEKSRTMESIDTAVREEFKRFPGLFPINLHYDLERELWKVLIEVVGTRILSPTELISIDEAVSRRINHTIDIFIWTRAETVVTKSGYISFEEFTAEKMLGRVKGTQIERQLPR